MPGTRSTGRRVIAGYGPCRRIVQAVQAGAWRKVKRLSYLLVHSVAARALAVKRVIENAGKKTPGVDGELWDTPEKKAAARDRIGQWRGYQPHVETKNRKPLRDNPLASWELRVGKYRVFYEVDDTASTVSVVSVGHKEHNVLLIRGKEVQL